MRIFIVDDDSMVADAMSLVLGAMGHDVRCASEAGAALEAVGADPPDVVVTDFNLPGMRGDALARQLRGRFPGLPVMVATGGFADADAVRRELQAEGIAFLAKPFTPRELLAALEKLRAGA